MHRSARVFLVLALGALCVAGAAMLLARGAAWSFGRFEALRACWWWWPFVSLPLGAVCLTCFMRRVGPGTEGSGIQQAVAAVAVAASSKQVSWFVNLRLATAKFFAIIAGLGSGFVLGLEGPTVQIGASVQYAFRRFLPCDNAAARRQLVMTGGAAGIAAAFNAPLAGMIFAFEELHRSLSWHSAARLIVAVMLAATLAGALGHGGNSYFGQVSFPRERGALLLAVLLLAAVLGGLVGGSFSWLALHSHRWMPGALMRLRMARPFLFAVACGLCIALMGLAAPIHGSGVELTRELLHGQASVSWQYLPLKFGALLLTVFTGVPGGIFAPSLSVGAGLGAVLLPLVQTAEQGALLAVSMTAVLAAATRAPITAVFIMMEMTQGYGKTLEFLAAAVIAASVARHFHTRFYHELAGRALRAMPASLSSPEKE